MALRANLNPYKLYNTVANNRLNLNGIFIPLTTPFNDNQEISYDNLKTNLNKYEEIPFTGYLVAGTNGEAPFLSPDERISLVKFVKKYSDKVIIGGSTCESTRACCMLTTEMMEAGADAVLVMPPFYFKKKMTDEAITTHYTTVADTCGAPIIIYNNTFVTGIDINTDTLTKLAQHPLIRGVKDSDIRKCAVTVQNTRGYNFDVLIGSAGYLLGALLNGCSGGMLGLAGLIGNELCNLYNLYQNGELIKARDLQQRVSKLDNLLLAEMGVPALKAGMDMMGLYGGLCRKPMLPLTEAEKEKVKKHLKEANFI